MLNGKQDVIEMNLEGAFEAGYSNAAAAFSQVVQHKVYCNNFNHSRHSLEDDFLTDRTPVNPAHPHELITTEVFGDVSGKSYLLLQQHEFELLTRNSNPSSNSRTDLRIEFIKELDNILSAAVITKLCNHLGLKMFGNIPQWDGPLQTSIVDLVRNDFNEDTAWAYISSARFSFDTYPEVHPFFIWVMDEKIMQRQKKENS
mgnify:CR=1 FL=1